MPFMFPYGHPYSLWYDSGQYWDNFTDFGFTQWFLGSVNDNVFHGDAGGDTMWGSKGEDDLYGNGGVDVLYGGDHDDDLYGGKATDYLFGGADDDRVFGGQAADVLHGDDGNDTLSGGSGNDILFGDDDEDLLVGDEGSDILFGGDGFDRLFGGANGAQGDVLTGGAHTDWFFFQAYSSGYGATGVDRITDFDQDGDDVLYFHADGVGSYGVMHNTIYPELGFGALVIAYDNGRGENVVFLEGVDPSTVTFDDVQFYSL